MSNPLQQSSACLAQSNESAAWVCSGRPFTVTLNGTFFSLGHDKLPDGFVTYGSQPYSIDRQLLTTANDPSYKNLGTAYYFRAVYNRTELLLEDRLAPQGQVANLTENWDEQVLPGQRPWLCVFPETSVEGYIYTSHKISSNQIPESQNRTAFRLPPLPYGYKITEQRVPNSTQPYCTQIMLMDDGKMRNIGAQFQLHPSEFGSMSQVLTSEEETGRSRERRQQAAAMNMCRCQWMVQ